MINEILKKLLDRKNLTASEASFAFEKLMCGELYETHASSFLTAMQMKGVSNNEIISALKIIRKRSVPFNSDIKNIVDTCGTGGDSSDTFNISTAAAFVAAGAGVNIAKHGNRSVSSKCGSADILEELGVKIDFKPEKAINIFEKTGIVFLFAPIYHPSFKNVSKVRKELGFRTVFNFLGPLSSPANAKRQVIGVYDPNLTSTVTNILKKLEHEHVICVHGNGLDEFTTSGKNKISELKDGKIRDYFLDAKDFGFKGDLEDIKGGDKGKNKKIILDVLKGKKGPRRDIVLLNSAAAIYVSGKANSIREGISMAEESIGSGKAMKKLDLLIMESNI